MTELRRELNITDDEHGQLLIKIKSDQSVKMIRSSYFFLFNQQTDTCFVIGMITQMSMILFRLSILFFMCISCREWRNGAPCAQEYSEDAPGYPPPQVVINAEPRKLETTHPPVSKSQKCVSYSHSCKETAPSAAPVSRKFPSRILLLHLFYSTLFCISWNDI